MFLQVLTTCEALFSVSLAVFDRTEELLLGSAVHAVDFAFMTQKTTRVCEAQQLGALRLVALVWPFVLVHVFAVQ